MNATLLARFQDLLDRSPRVLAKQLAAFDLENSLALIVAENNLADIETLVNGEFRKVQETLASIQIGYYPLRPGIGQRLKILFSSLRKKTLLNETTEKLISTYGIDDALIAYVNEVSTGIVESAHKNFSFSISELPDEWSLPQEILAKRAILISVSRAWTQENTDEPILWKLSAVLQTLASAPFYEVSTALFQLITAAQNVQANSVMPNTSTTFIADLNEDKAGNVLDNLYLSYIGYQSLLEEGWQPERWEVENLPMSISLFLDFLRKNGFVQVKEIGDIMQIGLNDANELYRYRGSPFQSSDDIKKVKVIIPGWKKDDELVIRPKVNEISV
jgi:hypothetical protein